LTMKATILDTLGRITLSHQKVITMIIGITSWRTLANQEVRLRSGPLAKLGRFKSTADNFLVYITTISLVSGPIQSRTSWYAKILHDYLNGGLWVPIL